MKHLDELLNTLRHLQTEFDKRWKAKNLDAKIFSIEDLELETQSPNFWDEPEKAKKISQKLSALEKTINPWKTLKNEIRDFPELCELTLSEYDQGKQKDGLEILERELDTITERYEKLLLEAALMGADDPCNAIITINSGAGGTESQDWAQMLLRMYLRWAEKQGYKVSILDIQNGEEAGIKTASLLLEGENAFGLTKSENGIHRLVRISPFDSNKRRHTSFASIHVMPEIDDNIDILIEDKDLRIDTYRASGAGGQHINKTDSAIRITHIPTNIVVQCQNERSQHKNKATAMKMLKSRLYEVEKEKKMEDVKNRSGEKKNAAWGNQIRSYVMHPYKMVKDLRTEYETSNVEAVMDGDLTPFIKAFLKSMVMTNE